MFCPLFDAANKLLILKLFIEYEFVILSRRFYPCYTSLDVVEFANALYE